MESVDKVMDQGDGAMNTAFWKNKRVLVTGCTGFKGTWLSKILLLAGSEVIGYALKPPTNPSLWDILGLENDLNYVNGDIRDLDHLRNTFASSKPDIVFHLAAQPIVRESYKNPVDTYATNVMGTVNILECVRMFPCVRSFVNVTTDKVYQNNEWEYGYRENDTLDGYDPYSNSKSCSELVTASYLRSFFRDKQERCSISTARAGNVIGGGDYASDRIVPDCVRAAATDETIIVRNPYSIRPYQHVLEPLYAYLLIAMKQFGTDGKNEGNYNVGPEEKDCITSRELVQIFCDCWGDGLEWKVANQEGPHEAGYLKLDCSRIRTRLGWTPRWDIHTALEKTVEWYKTWELGGDVAMVTDKQIRELFDI